MHKLVISLCFITLAVSSWANDFAERLKEGNALLAQGDTDGAMTIYRDLQTERPDSPLLYYNLGCANYRAAEQALENQDSTAPELFEKAYDNFNKARTAPEAKLRTAAAYDAINSEAQMVKLGSTMQSEDKLRDSIKSYEEFLKQHPGHKGAQTNLDNMRYTLKKMLQNPPPPQEQQQQENQQGESKEEQDQDQGEQNQQDQQNQEESDEQDQQQDQQQSGDESKENKDDQQQNQENQEQQEQQEQQQPQDGDQQQEQPQDQESSDQAAAQQQQAQGDDEQQPEELDRQNVEALLQSLADEDKREQKQMKKGQGQGQMQRNWW